MSEQTISASNRMETDEIIIGALGVIATVLAVSAALVAMGAIAVMVIPIVPQPLPAIVQLEWVKPTAPLPSASQTEWCGDCTYQKEAPAVTRS
jgi:hypothetical protein